MRTPLQMYSKETLAERALERWGDTVYRVALSRVGSTQEAEDVSQDVFLKLLDHPREFESDEHLKAWLIRVTINRSRDILRAHARHASESWEEHESEAERILRASSQSDGAPQEAEADESSLRRAISQLPEEQRTVVHLFYVEELSTQEIASALNCSSGAVRTRLYRARETLRTLLVSSQPN